MRVELVIAEGHGVEGKQGVEPFLKGKTEDTMEEASLHLIAPVQRKHMCVFFLRGLHGSRKACGGVFLKLTEKIFVSTNIFS